MPTLLVALTVVTALGSGVMGGVFFAFSTFVMRALARLPAAQGAAAMQAVNVTVLNPLFLGVFVGTAVAGLALAVLALVAGHAAAPWQVAGGALYVVGTFGVTAARNVPLNQALARADAASAAGQAEWARYLVRWSWWNHVRTAAAVASLGALLVALLRG